MLKDLRKFTIFIILWTSEYTAEVQTAVFGETEQNRASPNTYKNGPDIKTDLVATQKSVQLQLKWYLLTNFEK